ncbi:MAG: helix-turn-helix domain-containing protein [Elstera sp.]|uniref:helix-turn-helix domain-containing protein n=1 Tax=Elstera sp. TaxID=1916664 RepID=UPI0037C113F6
MAIRVHLDRLMVEKKLKSKDLAEALGITEANFSLLKNGHVKGIRFGTLDKLCTLLNCQPGDLLSQIPDDTD